MKNCKYYTECGNEENCERCNGYEVKNKYPDYIMETLRQRLGLDKDDTSRDEYINTYSPNEAFEEVLTWNGICGFSYTIKSWIESIYGIDLDSLKVENS